MILGNIADNESGVYFDDLTILSLFYAVFLSEKPDGLQKEIECLHAHCEKWRLKLSTEKSKVLVFKKWNTRVNYNWYYNGTQLTVSNRIPYLGLLFSSNVSFHQAQLILAGRANKAVYMLYRKFQNVQTWNQISCLTCSTSLLLQS